MYKQANHAKTGFNINQSVEGETIEQKVNRIVNNKEPIKDGAPLVYTERKDRVQAAHNIRTDRFEIAVEAMDKISKSVQAKREHRMNPVKIPDENIVKIGGAETIQSTDGNQ